MDTSNQPCMCLHQEHRVDMSGPNPICQDCGQEVFIWAGGQALRFHLANPCPCGARDCMERRREVLRGPHAEAYLSLRRSGRTAIEAMDAIGA